MPCKLTFSVNKIHLTKISKLCNTTYCIYFAQADNTKRSASKYLYVVDIVCEKILKAKVSGEKATVTETNAFSMSLEKRILRNLPNEEIGTGRKGSGFILPSDIFSQITKNGSKVMDNETEVSCQVSGCFNKI